MMTLSPLPAPMDDAALPSLDGAVVRSWSFHADTFTWSLLVRCPEHGWAPLTLTYTGAFLMRVDGTVLDDVPLETGRSYVVHAHHAEPTEIGGVHRIAFWPTPQFKIGFAQLSWQQGIPRP